METTASRVPPIGIKDLRVAFVLLIGFPLSWLIPERHWGPAARLFMRIRDIVRQDRASRIRHIRSVAGAHALAAAPEQCADQYYANVFLDRLQLFRCYRPDGWNPSWRLDGREHIDRAVGDGRGIILWFAPSSFYSTVSKRAVFEAGHLMHYLSRYLHNLTDTTWGARWLNPVRTAVENRYIAERLVIWPGAERETFDGLVARLQEHKIVGLAVGNSARRVHEVPFLDGRLPIATAPAALSIRLGAPLIPVFTVREGDGSYTVTVSAPLAAPDSEDLPRAIESVLTQYRDVLEPYFLRYPDQFRWHEVLSN